MAASPVTIVDTEQHILHSECADADYQVRIGRPTPGWSGPSPEPPRILYVLDGDLFFGTAVEMTRLMHQLYGELPPLLVVGIGYGTKDPSVQGELRNRDFTPTSDAGFEEMGRRMRPGWTPLLPEGRRMGRASEFLAFLRGEVDPFVRGRFAAAGSGSILFGSSLGGLFALWTFLSSPDSFGHYVVASPAIWWDGEMLFGMEERMAEKRDDVEAKLFLGVGELEEPRGNPMLERFRLVSNVGKMAERLASRAYPSLELTTKVFDDESHTSVVPVVMTRGLRTVLR